MFKFLSFNLHLILKKVLSNHYNAHHTTDCSLETTKLHIGQKDWWISILYIPLFTCENTWMTTSFYHELRFEPVN